MDAVGDGDVGFGGGFEAGAFAHPLVAAGVRLGDDAGEGVADPGDRIGGPHRLVEWGDGEEDLHVAVASGDRWCGIVSDEGEFGRDCGPFVGGEAYISGYLCLLVGFCTTQLDEALENGNT